MRFFRKRDARGVTHPVFDFWAWWADAGHTINPSQASAATENLTRRVRAIHPELTWHFSRGAEAEHRLTVTAGGVAAVRPAAERWLRASPPADSTWEFRCSQEADPDALNRTLEIAGTVLHLGQVQFRIEPMNDKMRIHVGVHHPEFPTLPEAIRGQVSFLALDWLIGEDDVERWIGQVEPLLSSPDPPRTAIETRTAVAAMAALRGPESWMVAHGTDTNGRPFLPSWRRGVRWLDAPVLDRHQSVVAKYRAQSNGLPVDSKVLPELRIIEEELEVLVRGRGMLVATSTRDGARTYHAYTDGEDQNVDTALRDWARNRKLTLESKADPGWSDVRVFTG